jgi:predicted ArsR family transcriptional regulator
MATDSPLPPGRLRTGEAHATRGDTERLGVGGITADRNRPGDAGADAPRRRQLLLQLLRESPQPRSILSLAEELQVHANTVRFHLETLLRVGQVAQLLGDPTGPGRPPVLFRATHRMDPSGPTNYRLLAGMLTINLATTSPDPAAAATQLGRVWGPHLLDATTTGQLRPTRVQRGEALTRVLSDVGFAPEPPTGPRDATIRLRHCPFLSLVTATTAATAAATAATGSGSGSGSGAGEVICALHLGLMQGALASLHGPVTVDRLDPFVEADLCVAHVAPAKAAAISLSTAATRHGRANE